MLLRSTNCTSGMAQYSNIPLYGVSNAYWTTSQMGRQMSTATSDRAPISPHCPSMVTSPLRAIPRRLKFLSNSQTAFTESNINEHESTVMIMLTSTASSGGSVWEARGRRGQSSPPSIAGVNLAYAQQTCIKAVTKICTKVNLFCV